MDRTQRKIVVAFDASCLVTAKKTGVAVYTENLILHLAKKYPNDIEFVGHFCNFLGMHKVSMPQAQNIRYRPTYLLPVRVVNLIRRIHVPIPFELLMKTHADFHLFPAFIGWPSLYKTPSAVVIHDLAYLEMPETVSAVNRHDLTELVPIALERSIFALTPSQATRDTLQQTYGRVVPPCIVTRIPPTPATSLQEAEALAEVRALGVSGKFILSVGTLEPRKNLTRLIQAYSQLPNALRQSHALVLAGSLGWNSQEITAALNHALETKVRIIHTGYISDRQKTALYMQASLLAQPSLYEGFGMPILEAMSYQLPVVASDIPVFHEVAGKAAIYVDPYDTASLVNAMKQVLTDKRLYSTLQQQSHQHIHHYPSWGQIAEDVYKAVAKAARSD